jgi:hypothetical protein
MRKKLMILVNLIADPAGAANIVNYNGKLKIVISNLPNSAKSVQIVLLEVNAANDEATKDRKLMTIKGVVSKGKFSLEQAPPPDPFSEETYKNPELHDNGPEYSQFPPELIVLFNNTEYKLHLPDKKDEKLMYEISAECYINGVLDSKLKGSTQVRRPVDVMVVPNIPPDSTQTGERDLFRQASKFATQWFNFAKARRSITHVAVNSTLTDFETALVNAASVAKYGDVLLFTGHGGNGGDRVDVTCFDTTPYSVHGMNNHPNKITTGVLDLPLHADRQKDGKWVWKQNHGCGELNATVDNLGQRYDMLVRIGNSFKANNVARFIVLSCNVGNDKNFGFKLSKILNTTVCLYPDFVSTRDILTNNVVDAVQTYLLGEKLPPVDIDDRSTREIPRGYKTF